MKTMNEGSVYLRPDGQFILVFYAANEGLNMKYSSDGKKKHKVDNKFLTKLFTCVYLGEL